MKNLSMFLILISLSSCNKKLMNFCKAESMPNYQKCYNECEFALPEPANNLTKEEAVKKCQKTCKTKLNEDKLNCYYSGLVKCARKCARKKAKQCRKDKRSCKRTARQNKRNCIRATRATKRNCIQNCKNNSRGRQRRRCKRDCRRVFRGAKRACRSTFKNAKSQCKSVNCKKSAFSDECLKECN